MLRDTNDTVATMPFGHVHLYLLPISISIDVPNDVTWSIYKA